MYVFGGVCLNVSKKAVIERRKYHGFLFGVNILNIISIFICK